MSQLNMGGCGCSHNFFWGGQEGASDRFEPLWRPLMAMSEGKKDSNVSACVSPI